MSAEEEKAPDAEPPQIQLTPQEEDLINAIENNNIDEVRRGLMKGVDVNFIDRNGSTPLFHSCSTAQIDITRFLVS
jgi:hypothetical protein